MDGDSPWVEELLISPRISEKVAGKHHLDPEAVRSQIERREGLTFSWDEHPTYGWRMLGYIEFLSVHVLVILYPTDDLYIWNLGSAYQVQED